jgi:hypothetical protein
VKIISDFGFRISDCRRLPASQTRGLHFIVLAAVALFATAARAQQLWTLTTADFRTESVRLIGIDAERGLRVATAAPAASERVVPFDQFLSLHRSGAATSTAPGGFLAVLTDGDRLAGEPVSTAGETITWNSQALGTSGLPMRRMRAILRAGAQLDDDGNSADPQRAQDLVLLANGDTVAGIVAQVTGSAVTVHPAGGGDPTVAPLDSILAVLFAPAPSGTGGTTASSGVAEPPRRSFRITLTDGSAISVPSVSLGAGANPSLRLSPGDRSIGLDSVVSIEHVNGPVIWLSALTPAEDVHVPFLDLSWPARFDRTVRGEPIRFGERTFGHGIGVHAYSRLSFAVDPSVKAFRTQYGIDPSAGDAPFADVTVRVKLDGRVAHERADVRAGGLLPLVQMEIGGARTITLEVDYGQNHDVQDRFVWVEPALLRYLPAPATTQPSAAPATQP